MSALNNLISQYNQHYGQQQSPEDSLTQAMSTYLNGFHVHHNQQQQPTQQQQQEQEQQQLNPFYNVYDDPLTPRYDSDISLHEDVGNFLSCLRLALINPSVNIDDFLLERCIGFAQLFPHVDGLTQSIWGNQAVGADATDSQQKMLLWMQAMQERIEEATARNLDVAAAAFGACEEARRVRGVSGRSDVEGVRQDLEWWLEQHAELTERLKLQRKYIAQHGSDTRSISGSIPEDFGSTSYENQKQQQQQLHKLPSSLPPLPPLSESKLFAIGDFTSNNNTNANNANNTGTLQKRSSASDLFASSSQLQYENENNKHQHQQKSSSTKERSTSELSGATGSTSHLPEMLAHELLALQSTSYRVSSIAQTREKLAQCVLALPKPQTYVRTATHPQPF